MSVECRMSRVKETPEGEAPAEPPESFGHSVRIWSYRPIVLLSNQHLKAMKEVGLIGVPVIDSKTAHAEDIAKFVFD